jgi:hypothetical protein
MISSFSADKFMLNLALNKDTKFPILFFIRFGAKVPGPGVVGFVVGGVVVSKIPTLSYNADCPVCGPLWKAT